MYSHEEQKNRFHGGIILQEKPSGFLAALWLKKFLLISHVQNQYSAATKECQEILLTSLFLVIPKYLVLKKMAPSLKERPFVPRVSGYLHANGLCV